MRVINCLMLIICLTAIFSTLLVAQDKGVATAQSTATKPEAPSEPSALDKMGLAGLVCFGSALSYAWFGMPKSRRFTRIVGSFGPGGREHKRTRRALELLIVAFTGGLAGYFLLTPTNGGAAISAGAMWYGTLYRIVQDDSAKK